MIKNEAFQSGGGKGAFAIAALFGLGEERPENPKHFIDDLGFTLVGFKDLSKPKCLRGATSFIFHAASLFTMVGQILSNPRNPTEKLFTGFDRGPAQLFG
jgi:hypothetical protein